MESEWSDLDYIREPSEYPAPEIKDQLKYIIDVLKQDRWSHSMRWEDHARWRVLVSAYGVLCYKCERNHFPIEKLAICTVKGQWTWFVNHDDGRIMRREGFTNVLDKLKSVR